MWMNGSSWARSTPANARRTGKPSPSKPDGAVVTESTGRSAAAAGSGSWTRGSTRMSGTVIAGMTSPSAWALAFRLTLVVPTMVDSSTFPLGAGAVLPYRPATERDKHYDLRMWHETGGPAL